MLTSSLLAQQPQCPQQRQLARRRQVQLQPAQGEHHVQPPGNPSYIRYY